MKNLAIIPALFFALAFSLTATAQEMEAPAFGDFLAQFPKASLPYAFDAQALAAKPAAKAKRLDWQFYQFLPELEHSAQFSNMPVYPEPVAAFETKEYVAVLYNVARGAGKNNKTYTISVFDHAGNHIATNFVAGANKQNLTVATIHANLKAEVKTIPVSEGGLDNNEAAAHQLDLTTPGNPDQLDWTAISTKANNSSDLTKN